METDKMIALTGVEGGSQFRDSKTRIPEAAHSLIERTRLVEEISASGAEVCIFNAGAGFGKTILMAELARKYDGQYIWYQIDGTDNDPICFLQGLMHGISKLPTPFHLPVGRLREPEELHSAVLALAEWLSRTLTATFYFMFDDLHEIEDESVFTIIRLLIDNTPEDIRFCFTVKGGFPKFLASYLLKSKAILVEAEKLRFTKEETGQLLHCLTGHTADAPVIENIAEYIEGWPAGVMFAGLAIKSDSTFKSDNSSGDIASVMIHTKIYDYIHYEIFRKLPFDMQRFLMDTAPLQSLSVPLCNHVTGRIDSGSILDYLVGENLFIYKFKGWKKWYRYHSIFQDFLLSRLDGERKKEILNKAAYYFLKIGESEQAVLYGMKAMAYTVVEIAVEKEAVKLAQEGRQATVSQWIHFLEPVSERLGSRCLYEISRYYLLSEEEEKAVEYLRLAAEKACSDGEKELYGQYGIELLGYLNRLYGLRRAKEQALQMAEHMKNGQADHNYKLLIPLLEYRLQLGEWEPMEEVTKEVSENKRRIHTTMVRNAVIWLLSLRDKCENWENTLEEARMYRRLSPVFAEYGFYRYGWFLYLKNDRNYRLVMEEGLSIGGGSIFAQWMRLLLILQEYREKKSAGPGPAEELRQIEEQMDRQGIDYPAFLERDAELLSGIIMGQEPYGEQDKAGRKQGTGETVSGEKAKLEVFCLGSFTVKTGGVTLVWRTRKSRELFACLFVQNGKGLDKTSLIFRLWPDASEKNGSTLFNTTVSYLRKTLAQADAADALLVKDRQYSLDMKRIWSDYGRLEELALLVRRGEFDRIENPRELAELYNGEYLESEDYRWMVGRKEYVGQMFMQAAENTAKWEKSRKHYDTAIAILQKMLEVNSYSAGALRLLLKCRMESGDLNGAKRQYEKMRQIWKREWDQELGHDFTDFITMSEEEEL